MPVKALLDALNKESQSMQAEKVKQAKQKLVTHPIDAIKNDIMQLALKHSLILVPIASDNKEQEQNDNVMSLELKPDVVPQSIPDTKLDNILPNPNPLPALKLNFVGKTKDTLTDEEAKLLEANSCWLESSFETFKKELGAQGMASNNFTAVMRTGTFPINIPSALYRFSYIEKMFDKFLELVPSSAPQAAATHINNQLLPHETLAQPPEENKSEQKANLIKSPFNPSPFSLRPKPPGTIGH